MADKEIHDTVDDLPSMELMLLAGKMLTALLEDTNLHFSLVVFPEDEKEGNYISNSDPDQALPIVQTTINRTAQNRGISLNQ